MLWRKRPYNLTFLLWIILWYSSNSNPSFFRPHPRFFYLIVSNNLRRGPCTVLVSDRSTAQINRKFSNIESMNQLSKYARNIYTRDIASSLSIWATRTSLPSDWRRYLSSRNGPILHVPARGHWYGRVPRWTGRCNISNRIRHHIGTDTASGASRGTAFLDAGTVRILRASCYADGSHTIVRSRWARTKLRHSRRFGWSLVEIRKLVRPGRSTCKWIFRWWK